VSEGLSQSTIATASQSYISLEILGEGRWTTGSLNVSSLAEHEADGCALVEQGVVRGVHFLAKPALERVLFHEFELLFLKHFLDLTVVAQLSLSFRVVDVAHGRDEVATWLQVAVDLLHTFSGHVALQKNTRRSNQIILLLRFFGREITVTKEHNLGGLVDLLGLELSELSFAGVTCMKVVVAVLVEGLTNEASTRTHVQDLGAVGKAKRECLLDDLFRLGIVDSAYE